MLNPHPRYTCFPSVVCVNQTTEVTVFPRDINRRFRSDKAYQLSVVGLRDDEIDYHTKAPFEHPFEIVDGCMKFTHYFEKEQEYSIRFCEENGSVIKVPLYAVEQDLYELRPLKGDLHTHSYYSDGQDGIAMVPADYREEGYDFFALTDHNRMFPSKLIRELYKDVPLGIHFMTGEEVHTPGTALHIVHIGGENSVCEKYIHQPDVYEQEVSEIESSLENIPVTYRHRFAMAKWACAQIHKEGGLAIFPHPFWRPNRYNVTSEFSDLLFDADMFDAFELMGGPNTQGNNLQLALWQEQLMKGNRLPVVGSTDSHNHDFSKGGFARRFTIVFAKSNTTKDILEAIKSGYSVAAELPLNDDYDVRFYGSQLRLILFSHFLYTNYFNETWRLCIGEGILMRRYAEGEPVGDILASVADTVENFYKKFYGLTPVSHLSDRCLDFSDKCLDAQLTVGPATKGSAIHIYGGNERRV